MIIYPLMKKFAREKGTRPAPDLYTPELGKSLSLFHSSLLDSNLDHTGTDDTRRITASPKEIRPDHLSRFVVAFLPFNSISTSSEANDILFDVFSFLRWLERRDIPHGLSDIDFQATVRELTRDQERCLQLSHFLDDESGKILEDPPHISLTVNDVFQILKIEGDFVYLKGRQHPDPLRIKTDAEIRNLMRPNDYLELVLGDTSEKWVILEAGEVFPGLDAVPQSSSS